MQIKENIAYIPNLSGYSFSQETLKTERYIIHICTINILIFHGIGMSKFS